MQKIDTTSSPALAPAKTEWDFVEVWIDPLLSPPYLLLLMGEPSGSCHIYDPGTSKNIRNLYLIARLSLEPELLKY